MTPKSTKMAPLGSQGAPWDPLGEPGGPPGASTDGYHGCVPPAPKAKGRADGTGTSSTRERSGNSTSSTRSSLTRASRQKQKAFSTKAIELAWENRLEGFPFRDVHQEEETRFVLERSLYYLSGLLPCLASPASDLRAADHFRDALHDPHA